MSLDSPVLDVEVEKADVLELSCADALAAFFARLNYNTNARIAQTPDNLGISADSLKRQIKAIELVADQDGFLQVYLFQLKSVTVAATQGIARAFRNRAGNFMLVLTDDFERLDFVLLQRVLGTKKPGKMGRLQAGIAPRSLSVDRRNPEQRALRVLRRLTYTQAAPVFQYEKLCAAFDVAYWSEEFFDNRSLFSDYYLLKRMCDEPEWHDEDATPAYRRFADIAANARTQWSNQPLAEVRKGLLEPTLEALGFKLKPGKPAKDDAAEPDYQLFTPDGKTHLADCNVYPWARSLDAPDREHDRETPDVNPGALAVSLLQREGTQWAIVTNGKDWRLYAARAHNKATNYYQVDLEEIMARNDPAESFRYFWFIFRREAFEPQAPSGDMMRKRPTKADRIVSPEQEGEEQAEAKPLCFLDRLFDGSQQYAKELGERLKERVFEHIFPHFAAGFIDDICDRRGVTRSDLDAAHLDAVFQGTLTFLYRLLFLLYAEARDLLPVKEFHGFHQKSLSKLKSEVADKLGEQRDRAPQQAKAKFSASDHALYDRLSRLFAVIDQGDPSLNVPVYNGGLFLTQVPDDDDSPEARNARFLTQHKIGDRYLALGLDLLARDEDQKSFTLVPIDYKSLGVRQLGSMYEGLLEFKVRVAKERIAVVKVKGKDVYKPVRELAKTEREKWDKAVAREKNQPGLFASVSVGREVKKNQVYLENDKRERKATGSYYTPDYIVKYIVEHTVGPVLEEKLEAARKHIRDAQRDRRNFFKRQEGLRAKGLKTEPDAKAELYGEEVVDQLFDVKVLDPAMGSGHFLVEAVDFITDKMLSFLAAFPWNPVIAALDRTRATILDSMDKQGVSIDAARLDPVHLLKRHVLKRCIYGVDLNPMAVELAKVSLWLDCFTLGAPLSFLDHHLKCGNSLIGSDVAAVQKALEESGKLTLFETSEFARMLMAVDLMQRVGKLSDVTPDMVHESRDKFREAVDALAPAKRVMDVYTSRWFGNEPVTRGRGKKKDTEDMAIEFLRTKESEPWLKREARTEDLPPADRKVAETALAAAQEKRFFHWELEFPEVFFGAREGATQVIEKKPNPGFDAVVGNPPYDEVSEFEARTNLPEKTYYKALPLYEPAMGGRVNLYRLFICRVAAVVRGLGCHGMIVPMSLLADRFAVGVRSAMLLRGSFRLIEAFPQKDDEKDRVFVDAKLSTCVYVNSPASPPTPFHVRTHPGRAILPLSPSYTAQQAEIIQCDPTDFAIPCLTAAEWDIRQRLLVSEHCVRFHDYCDPTPGEIVFNKQFQEYLTDDPCETWLLRGAQVGRYSIAEVPKQGEPVYLRKSDYLASTSPEGKAFHHRKRRVIYQECAAIDNWRRLIVAMAPEGTFLSHTVSYLWDPKISDLVLLAFLNSSVLEWLFAKTSTNNHVNAYEVANLPIRCLHFATSRSERDRLLDELSTSYAKRDFGDTLQSLDALVPRDAKGRFLAFRSTGDWEYDPERRKGRGLCPEKSDVVHDFLAYLAEQMIDMNKAKQAEQKRLFAWLEGQLHIDSDKKGHAGIDTLSGKTIIKNYLGDYQKGEDVTDFGRILDVLHKNKGRIRANLSDPAFVRQLEKQYHKSLDALVPIKDRLAKTDWLIDQIVYKLYGLTEEEIAIVEGRK